VSLTPEYKSEVALKNTKKTSLKQTTSKQKDFKLSVVKQVKASDLSYEKSIPVVFNLFLIVLFLLF
jgi:hypothetical protein